MDQTSPAELPVLAGSRQSRAQASLAYARRNPALVVGSAVLFSMILFGLVGPLLVDTANANPLSAVPNQSPSRDHPLGTDSHGRDLLAVMIVGIPLTLRIGLLAGAIGLGIGVVLGVIAGYSGGYVDAIIRGLADTLLTVPSLLILIVIASSIRGFITVEIMALVIGSLAWTQPTRTIRAQVLTLRERGYVKIAEMSGMNKLEIIAKELTPNLLPYIAMSFVGAVAYAILAAIGLEALGLGPQNEPTVGMTIYWAINFNALLRGLWWWWIPPIVVVVTLFISLFLISSGIDEIANPRVRRSV